MMKHVVVHLHFVLTPLPIGIELDDPLFFGPLDFPIMMIVGETGHDVVWREVVKLDGRPDFMLAVFPEFPADFGAGIQVVLIIPA